MNQVGGGNGARRPRRAILPTDNSRPHTLASAFSVTFPADWRQGSALGAVLRNVERVHDLPLHQRHGLHQVRLSTRTNSVLIAVDVGIENCVRLTSPRASTAQRLPAFKELDAELTKSFGLGGLD